MKDDLYLNTDVNLLVDSVFLFFPDRDLKKSGILIFLLIFVL